MAIVLGFNFKFLSMSRSPRLGVDELNKEINNLIHKLNY